MNELIPSFGALESKKDYRTITHDESLAAPIDAVGGFDYLPSDIEHQHQVGICTAISLVQNAQKAIGRRFSPDFQYLLQKKYYDPNWSEGSSILTALKVGKNYGFLPIEEFTYVTETDRNLPYNLYIQKLMAISDAEIQRLINLCSDYKLSGFAYVNTDPHSLSAGIRGSRSGIICRFEVGEEWWTSISGRSSWDPKDINPLRRPSVVVSGHAIIDAKYDYSEVADNQLANTWGPDWCMKGRADIIISSYSPTEAWIPYYGLTEEQTQELHRKLEAKITLLRKLIELTLQLFKKK